MKLIQRIFFPKILAKFDVEANFKYASLTREDPFLLQITYHYVYHLKYS